MKHNKGEKALTVPKERKKNEKGLTVPKERKMKKN